MFCISLLYIIDISLPSDSPNINSAPQDIRHTQVSPASHLEIFLSHQSNITPHEKIFDNYSIINSGIKHRLCGL